MIKKTVIIIFFVVSTLAFWQVFFSESKKINVANTIDSSASSISNNRIEQVQSGADTKDAHGITDEDRQNLVDWHEDDVTKSKIEHQDYATYDDNMLEQLIKNGDVRAMKVLALRYLELLKNEQNPENVLIYNEKHNELVQKTILYGDRQLLTSMPGLNREVRKLLSPNLTDEEKLDTVTTILAHYEFMAMRGSLADKYDQQRMFFNAYQHLGLPTSLSEADKNQVRMKAHKIYDELEQKRIELGLGAFDNSIPESARKAYEIQKQRYLSEMGPLAIE